MFTIEGLDITRYQSSGDGTQVFDFSKSVGKVQFFILRSSVGTGTDYRLDDYVNGCREYDFPFGLYHYAKPAHNWQVQAQLVVDLVKKYSPNLDIWLDMEESGGLGKTALYGWVSKFLILYTR